MLVLCLRRQGEARWPVRKQLLEVNVSNTACKGHRGTVGVSRRNLPTEQRKCTEEFREAAVKVGKTLCSFQWEESDLALHVYACDRVSC